MQNYGHRLDEHWKGLSKSASIELKSVAGTRPAVTRVAAGPGFGFVEPVPAEDAYALSIELIDYEGGELWLDSKSTNQTALSANNSAFFDLSHQVEAKLDGAFDFVQFYLPKLYLRHIAQVNGLIELGDMKIVSGQGFHDPTILHLALALAPALHASKEVNPLFLDHMLMALSTHVINGYATKIPIDSRTKGLSPWRLNRAKDMIASRLSGELTISQIASECGLTPSYFSRQFLESTGVTPHRWLLQARVETAKDMLRLRQLSLSEIAIACGFADQSHFTRVFSRHVGASPRNWRDLNVG